MFFRAWIMVTCIVLSASIACANHSALRVDPFNTLPDSYAATFRANSRNFWDHENAQLEGETLRPYIVSGGIHGLSSSLVSPAFSTVAHTPERLNQISTAIVYDAIANDICWTIISSDNNGITGWTRVGVTSYYYQCEGDTTPNRPTLPANSAWLMGPITITGSAIITVVDARDRIIATSETIAFSRSVHADATWTFLLGGEVVPALNVILTFLGTKIDCHPRQACFNISASGSAVRLNDKFPVVYPSWWGGDPTGVLDSAPAINAAEKSGAKYINMLGQWGLASPIFITQGTTVFDCISRVHSHITPLAANIATGGSPNALFVNRVNAWNGTLRSCRFLSVGVSYTGWSISAVEGGTAGEQAMISGHFHDLWVSPGTLGAGFFTGGTQNTWFHDIQFENVKTRFQIIGGLGNLLITNIDDFNNYDPFIEAVSSTTNGTNLTIANINATSHHRDFYIKLKGVDNVSISNVNYTMDDDGLALTAGFASLETCLRCAIVNFNTKRVSGAFSAFLFTNSQVTVSHGNMSGNNGLPFDIQGTTGANEVHLDDVYVNGGSTDQVRVGSGAVGLLRVSNSTLGTSGGRIVNLDGSLDATFTNNRLINGNYNVPESLAAIVNNSSGKIVFQNNTFGLTDSLSKNTYVFLMAGSGEWWMFNNRIVGMLEAKVNSPATTQVPKLRGNFFVTTGTQLTEWIRTGAATPVGVLVPAFRGEEYLDTVAQKWYKAFGYTNVDWVALN